MPSRSWRMPLLGCTPHQNLMMCWKDCGADCGILCFGTFGFGIEARTPPCLLSASDARISDPSQAPKLGDRQIAFPNPDPKM